MKKKNVEMIEALQDFVIRIASNESNATSAQLNAMTEVAKMILDSNEPEHESFMDWLENREHYVPTMKDYEHMLSLPLLGADCIKSKATCDTDKA